MPILTPEERLGQWIDGRYRLDTVLSTGGMGVLYRAFDVRACSAVAVKTLKPVYALEPERVARFLREISIAERVEHPNVARTLAAAVDASGAPFLIMELLQGHSLEHELEQRGTLPLTEAVAIALPIMRALAAAHALGIIHRDVKPSNIFLSSSGAGREPKLLDFGIAKSRDDTFETQTGLFVGSPGYIAPEQAQYADCSPQTDIWALGAVLYRCLTGYAPHTESGDAELFAKLVRDPVPPLRAASVSKRASASIERALARDPSRRYASMEAFAEVLGELARREVCSDTGELSSSPPPSAAETPPHQRRWRPLLAVALATLTLAFTSASAGSSADGVGARAPTARPRPQPSSASAESSGPTELAPMPVLTMRSPAARSEPAVPPEARRRVHETKVLLSSRVRDELSASPPSAAGIEEQAGAIRSVDSRGERREPGAPPPSTTALEEQAGAIRPVEARSQRREPGALPPSTAGLEAQAGAIRSVEARGQRRGPGSPAPSDTAVERETATGLPVVTQW